MSKTLVTDITPLSTLKNLITLNMSGTPITDFTPLSMFGVTTLDISDTKFRDTKLITRSTSIKMSNTQIDSIADIGEFINFKKAIFLISNRISIRPFTYPVSPHFHFTFLRQLGLYESFIEFIYRRGRGRSLSNLEFANTPLSNSLSPIKIPEIDYNFSFNIFEVPSEIRSQGKRAITAYLESIEDAETNVKSQSEVDDYFRPLNEVKVILVGSGGAGKTSLIRKLMHQKFDPKEDQTHGIKIHKHPIEYNDTRIAVHFWDFGGQEINHATHQFFYSRRCLYILVLDARQDQKAEYWLKYIESFGGDSPVLIVLNKIDENPSFEVNRRFLIEKFSANINSESFFRISCQTGEGVKYLQETIKEKLYNLRLRKMPLSKSWFEVKESLTNMTTNYISYDRYFEICKEKGVVSTTAKDVLRELIHDLGLALDFKKLRRFDKQVLNPKWITKGVYRIINSKQIVNNSGALKLEQLNEILGNWERFNEEDDKSYEYPEQTHAYLTGIMKEFELCYELGKDEYIIPDLLPIQEPNDLDYSNYPLHFVIRYEDLLPRSVMPRFMVQMHHRIPQGTDKRWRTGVVISEPLYEASSIIRADYIEKEIHIWVRGKDRRQMLSFIRKTFEGIRASFTKLNVTEWVIIPNELVENKNLFYKNDKKILVKYLTLLVYERTNRESYFSPELEEEFRVLDLLNGIETPESRKKTPNLRAFISYSNKDEKLKDEFKVAVKPLTRSEFNIEFWDNREINAGEEWEKEILTELNRCELIFLLISPDSIASDYIWDKEVPVAIRRHNANEAIVFLVILRPCDWTDLDIAKIEAVPAGGGMPVTKWDNQDEAWLDTVKKIREVLQSGRLEKLNGRQHQDSQ